ncbi:hypothetical protein ACPZ19_48560 [Amycolatopsis lurida]
MPAQPAFRDRKGFGGYPWRLAPAAPSGYRQQDHPVTVAVLEDSFTLQRWHLW